MAFNVSNEEIVAGFGEMEAVVLIIKDKQTIFAIPGQNGFWSNEGWVQMVSPDYKESGVHSNLVLKNNYVGVPDVFNLEDAVQELLGYAYVNLKMPYHPFMIKWLCLEIQFPGSLRVEWPFHAETLLFHAPGFSQEKLQMAETAVKLLRLRQSLLQQP